MEHFIRIAFWIVALSGCLEGKSISKRSINIEDWNVEILKKIKCLNDSVFYTPTNIQEDCFTTALDYVKDEVDGTVRYECEESTERIGQAVDVLKSIISEVKERTNSLKPTESSTCEYGNWPKKPISDFVTEVRRLLEKINSSL